MKRFVALLGVMVTAGALAVQAAGASGPVHEKVTMTFPPVDFPAGTICDFNYREEGLLTVNAKVFLDEDGNPVRVEEQDVAHIVHTNVDTGFTLTEDIHYAQHFDFVAGEVALTGNWWHLRDLDGRIVFVGSGMFIGDLVTGELLKATPNVGADFAEVNCTALGGAPA